MLMRKLYGKKASNPHFLSKEKDIKIEEMHSPKDSASIVQALDDLHLQPNNEVEAMKLDQDVKAVTSKETEIPAKHMKSFFQ